MQSKDENLRSPRSAFNEAVAQVLAEEGISHKELATSTIGGWVYFTFWTVIFFGSLFFIYNGGNGWLLAPLAGLAMAPHLQFLAHEGVHLALTSNKTFDRFCGLYGTTAMSFSEFVDEHPRHHAVTNSWTKDQDFHQLAGLFRLSNVTAHSPWQKYQHWIYYFAWPAWAVMVTGNRLVSCFKYLVGYKYRTKTERWFERIVWVLSVFVINVLPFIAFGFTLEALWISVTPRAIQWWIIINLFQMSHFHDDSLEPFAVYDINPKPKESLFVRTMKTTNNICENSALSRYLMVGCQIQHHLLPNASASRNHLFINASRKVAAEYGLRYSSFHSFKDYIYKNYQFYRLMGKVV